jgi:hypothetical protein
MSDDGQALPAVINLEMAVAGVKSSGQAQREVRIGAIRLQGWQMHQVTPLPAGYGRYEGYVIEANYELDFDPGSPALSWFEIGFSFSGAAVVDVLPRTVVDLQQRRCYELNDHLRFVPSDEPGQPQNIWLPAIAPGVDVFGVGGPKIRWRRTGGVRPGSYVSWMVVLVQTGSEKLVVTATARYDISADEALRYQPAGHALRFELGLAAGRQSGGEINPVSRPGQSTRLVASGAPRVFVSYAHDDPSHVQAVLRLAELLGQCGIDTRLDRWDDDERKDWNLWAVDHITKADFVLVIASAQCKAVGGGEAGAAADRGTQSELFILRDRLAEDRVEWLRKILPVVLPDRSVDEIPLFLNPRNADHHVVRSFTESGAEGLLRAIMRQPR